MARQTYLFGEPPKRGKKVVRFSREHLVILAEFIKLHPHYFPGFKVIESANGGITVEGPGILFLAREDFPRGAKDLAFLSRARKYTRRLAKLTEEDLVRRGYIVVREFPQPIASSWGWVLKWRGKRVGYLDVKAAYWTALNWIYRDFFGENIPVDIEGVPKHLRNAAWGALGARKVVWRVDKQTRQLTAEEIVREPPPVYYAVPWLVWAWLKQGWRRGVFWTDSVIAELPDIRRVAERLEELGVEYHCLEGRLEIRGYGSNYVELRIVDPDTGKVLKQQIWPKAIFPRQAIKRWAPDLAYAGPDGIWLS